MASTTSHHLSVALTASLAGCVALPGGENQPCNEFGLCGPGLVCSAEDVCVAAASSCASGLCQVSGLACGWFVGPNDVSAAAEMCAVPAGTYQLGHPASPSTLAADTYIDRFEVTNLRYRDFIVSLGDAERAASLPSCDPGDRSWSATPPFYPSALANHPVVCISKEQAAAFCAWAGKRLPSDQEWEAAARGQDGRSYPWGNEDPDGTRANCSNRAGSAGYCNDTYPAGTCSNGDSPTLCADTAPILDPEGNPTLPDGASPAGALHMAGNAWEWTSRDEAGLGAIRGGSWADFFGELQVWSEREASPASYRKTTVGFRCAY